MAAANRRQNVTVKKTYGGPDDGGRNGRIIAPAVSLAV
jgi:hypothetical protein